MNHQFRIDRRDTLLAASAFAASVVMPAPASAQQFTSRSRVHRGTVKLADSEVEYFSQGSGEPIILLPGGSLSVAYLESIARELADAGYRAVRVNPRGAGTSTGSQANITLHSFAADVAGVVQDLKLGQVHVAGHAFGNRVARMLAVDQPRLVRSVVLLAAGGMVEPKEPVERALNTIFNPASSESELLEAMKYMVGNPTDAAEDPAKAWQVLKPSLSPKAGALKG